MDATAFSGDVMVNVVQARVFRPPYTDQWNNSYFPTQDELRIQLQLENRSAVRLLDYRGVAKHPGLTLTDNFGNRYHRISTPGYWLRAQVVSLTRLHPGKPQVDVVSFDVPMDGIDFLELKLPAESWGETGFVTFRIPARRIDR
jgi:hypothetical protein